MFAAGNILLTCLLQAIFCLLVCCRQYLAYLFAAGNILPDCVLKVVCCLLAFCRQYLACILLEAMSCLLGCCRKYLACLLQVVSWLHACLRQYHSTIFIFHVQGTGFRVTSGKRERQTNVNLNFVFLFFRWSFRMYMNINRLLKYVYINLSSTRDFGIYS